MGRLVPLPANALIFKNTADSADLLRRVMLKLERKKVSGYLRMQGRESDGYLFFSHGKAFDARFSAKVNEDKYLTGREAARALNSYCDNNSHSLLVYKLDPKVAKIIAGMTTGRDKHKRLSTEFVDIQKITRHLVVSAFSGYMHVYIPVTKRCAICVYNQGRVDACILYPLEGFEVLSKVGQWQLFLSEAKEQGAVFSIFESTESRWHPVKFGFIPKVQTHMAFLNDIFLIFENVFSSSNDAVNFEEHFVDACIQITDQYPFMHPFDNEVRYEQGTLEIGDNLEFTTVLKALNSVLKEVLGLVGSNGRNILAEVQAHIEEKIDADETGELKKFIAFLPLLIRKK